MNLSIFNSKIFKSNIARSLSATVLALSCYQLLVITKIVKPSDGLHQWQNNFIRLQRYAYQNASQSNIVLAGSSLTANLPASEIGSSVSNLGMSGGCTQTAVEAVVRKSPKPAIVIVEINNTIDRKIDNQMIDSIYNPFLYTLRFYLPIFREEYQPISAFYPKVTALRNKILQFIRFNNTSMNPDKKLTDTLISQFIEEYQKPVSEKQIKLIQQESEFLKLQISQLRKEGVRVVLFDIPRDPRLQATLQEKQIKALMKELFPVNQFEWLPEPPPRNWKTYDGVHIVSSDAKYYVTFLKNQLLTHQATIPQSVKLYSTNKPHSEY